MIKLEKFQKHIVLYCKGQYNIPEGDKGFFEGLKMIWAIRCGYDYETCRQDVLIYIANDLYEIISTCLPNKLPYLMEIIHKEVGNQAFYKPKDMAPIEAIIWEYRSILFNMQVRKKPEGKKRYQWLIKLDNKQPRLFNRILMGNGKYEDYRKVK
jgi:hypothetical protein